MRSFRHLLAASVIVFVACGKESTSPDTSVDVIGLADQMSTGGAASASLVGSGVSIPAGTAPSSSCPYSTTDQAFVCAPVTVNGLTFKRSIIPLDAAGQPLTTLNPALVVSIRTISDIDGTLLGDSAFAAVGLTATIDRHEVLTMTGLRTVHVVNGLATQQITTTYLGITSTAADTMTTSSVTLPPPRSAQLWPLSGTVTTDRSSTTSGTTTQSHSVMTYDGTSVVTITTTSRGITSTCKVDFAKPGPYFCVMTVF